MNRFANEHPEWTDRLSDFMDGGLGATDHAEVEAHLAECGDCRRILEGLRRVASRAADLGPVEPTRDLWGGIVATIEAPVSKQAGVAQVIKLPTAEARRREVEEALAPRRFVLTSRQLAAASVVLIAASSFGAALLFTAAAAVTSSPATPADTVVQIRPGDRVVLQNLAGRISVGTWERQEMEVRTDSDGPGITVRRSGSTVRVAPDDRKGRSRSVEASIRLPASVDLQVNGRSLELVVERMDGRIDVNNVSGSIWIEDAGGPVSVRTIEGEIHVIGARAGVTASSQSDDVTLRDVRGPIDVHSGDGDLVLADIVSTSVRAETQDGDIDFSGDITDGGEYGFFVHDGDATIAIPTGSNARVEVSTFDGEFESDFPVRLQRFTGGRQFDFTVGEPRAHIEIQVFDGEIRLLQRR